jgi:hypothetical protein
MSKRAELPQSRRHILVFDEDWDFLERAFGIGSPNRFGVGPAIRQIIHAKVKDMKAKLVAKRDGRQAGEQVAELNDAAAGEPNHDQ